ncbi:MAG TPA: alpha/beta fold hydrolase [Ktedonobacterales bacterium]
MIRRPAVFHSALLAALIMTFLVASAQVRAYTGNVRRDAFTLQGPIPAPVVRYMPPASARVPVVAVIAHGYSANKEIMSAFAVDLAKQGVTVYTFDFPGHGASTAFYGGTDHSHVVQQLVSSLGEVVDYATAHAAPKTKVVLLGYSLGTIAVGEYALQHPNMANLQATILVAGILNDKPTLKTPRNLLVLTGQFDLPGINDIARNSIAAACGATASSIHGALYQCKVSATNQRKRIILPGLDHISIVTAASTHDAVIQWLGATVDPRIGKTPVNADVRLHWMLVGFLAALLAVAPLIKLLALGFRLRPAQGQAIAAISAPGASPASQPSGDPTGLPRLLGFGALAATLGAALLGLRAALPSSFWAPDPFPFTFLRQQVSADVAIFFLFAGALITAAIWGIRRVRAFIRLPQWWREAAPQALIAVVVTAFLSVTLGALSSYAWESLTLEPQRLWRGAAYAIMIWPFFFGLRSLLHAMAPRLKHPALADLGASLLIIASLVGAIVMNFGRLSYLGILLPIVAIMLLLLAAASAWIRRTVAHPVALISVLEALLLAWILSATLPLVA